MTLVYPVQGTTCIGVLAACLYDKPASRVGAAVTSGATLSHLQHMIEKLDLSMVKRKLQDPEEGLGWPVEFSDETEVRYKRFLLMMATHPEKAIVPTGDIDAMWHQHILDTRAYAKNCADIFGTFVHHYPYFGMMGEDDERNLHASFAQTQELYATMFGDEYAGPLRGSSAGRCVKCGSGPVKCHHEPTRCR